MWGTKDLGYCSRGPVIPPRASLGARPLEAVLVFTVLRRWLHLYPPIFTFWGGGVRQSASLQMSQANCQNA